jgi:hypothetical protein
MKPRVLVLAAALLALGAPASASDAPVLDAGCLRDPAACKARFQAAAPENKEPAPAAEPAPEEVAAEESGPEAETEPSPQRAEWDEGVPSYASCVETSVRAGNRLDESARVCRALFGE